MCPRERHACLRPERSETHEEKETTRHGESVSDPKCVERDATHSHPVVPLFRCTLGRLPGRSIIDGDVEVAVVTLVGRNGYRSLDNISLVERDSFPEVEDGLLPVSILGVRASREGERLVRGSEGDIEPAEDGVAVCAL